VTNPIAVRAADMLEPNRKVLSRAIVRQLKRTVPRYEDVDDGAMQGNISTILRGLERLLRKGDMRTLKGIVESISSLRRTSGFGIDELLTAGLCFLPVLRRFFVEHEEDIGRGLDSYEAVEALVLPVFGHLASHFAELDDKTDPGEAWAAISFPLSVESIDEDEVTAPQRRPE
jgi:hypothetical protein